MVQYIKNYIPPIHNQTPFPALHSSLVLAAYLYVRLASPDFVNLASDVCW